MINIAIDARFLLRKQRGMPLYAFMLCKKIPPLMPEANFFFLINKGFEHNEAEELYRHRLEEISQASNTQIINADAEDEISWEQFILPKLLKEHRISLLHMPGNRVCLTTKVQQVVTLHDAIEWKRLSFVPYLKLSKGLRQSLYGLKINLYLWLNYALGSRKANHILTISQYAADSLFSFFPSIRSKTSYVYHGIPENFVRDLPIKSRSERKGVLMLGGDSYQKNPENAIAAWALLPQALRNEYPLTILGCTGGDSSPLVKKAKELDILEQITVKSWVTDEEIFQQFDSASLFLFASREEGFGFPLLQAMCRGTPTVTSKAQVLLEIGQNAVHSGDAESPESLSHAMTEVLTSEARWQELHQNALKLSSEFTWQTTSEKIASLYKELIASQR